MPAGFVASTSPSAPMFPIGDWQFWIVTTIALVAVIWLSRRLLPRRLFSAHRRGTKPATLTIGGKAVVGGPQGKTRHNS